MSERSLLERVRATGLLEPGRPVVVLLSGGRDSVCLLDVAVALGAHVTALHVNYGLRDEAGADQVLCEELSARLGVALEVRRAGSRHGNVQAWAREVRYAEAARLGDVVAAGHTITDQAETVLYRLAASPGRRALLGMAARSGRVVRPLLAAGVSRDETATWCAARGLTWCEDASNDDRRFARARVRGDLLPALRSLHPAAERNIARTAALLADEAAVLDDVVDRALDGDRIRHDVLRELPRALARLVVVRLGGAPAAERLDDVLGARDGAAVAVEGGVDLVIEGGWVAARDQRRGEPAAAEAPAAIALPVPGEVRFGAWTVSARPADARPVDGVLAAAGPFTVRAWRPGDRMAPLGMSGHTKSLQDLFVDRRVPQAQRATLPVVECDGEVAWIPGVATSERFRVGAATVDAVALSATR